MKKKYLTLVVILLGALVAGGFAFPSLVNRGIDSFNSRFSQNIPHFWSKPFRLGLDLQGGVSLIYEADLSNVGDGNKAEAMAGLRDVIERRVNLFGVTEPVVQVQGENRLVVELAGVTNVDDAIAMIGETPYLEFLEQRTEEETKKILDKIEEIKDKDFEAMQEVTDWQIAFQHPYFVATELTGKYLKTSSVIFDQTSFRPTIQLQLNDEGAKLFEEITGRNINKPLAIFLDGKSIVDTTGDGIIDNQDLYAPIVEDKISGGKAIISGGDMSTEKANQIVRRLNSGALPVKIGAPVSQKTVGPTLGEASLAESLVAGIFGFLAILIFLAIFYRIPGILAAISLLIYAVLMLAVVKVFSVTLTLAGIAGFILSMGMAVDANILMFSRMKEELKSGKSFGQSVTDGLKRAWPSIRDGNFTTILVGMVLFFFGTSFVKGFSLTLILGNLIGMFTSVFITNYFLKFFPGDKKIKWLWR